MSRKPLSGAVEDLFSGVVVSHYKELRNVLNKLEGKGIILRDPNEHSYDKGKYFTEEAYPAIHNAVLLHGLFSLTKRVEDIFLNPELRLDYAQSAEKIMGLPFFIDVGINCNRQAFIEGLASGESLTDVKLPNPFRVLPQVAFGGKHSTLVEVGLKCHSRSAEYKMLDAYLKKDIEAAYSIALSNQFSDAIAQDLQQQIISKYEGAVRAQNFLRKFI